MRHIISLEKKSQSSRLPYSFLVQYQDAAYYPAQVYLNGPIRHVAMLDPSPVPHLTTMVAAEDSVEIIAHASGDGLCIQGQHVLFRNISSALVKRVTSDSLIVDVVVNADENIAIVNPVQYPLHLTLHLSVMLPT